MKPAEGLAQAAKFVDQQIVDGIVDAAGKGALTTGRWLQPIQNGLVQFYALGSFLGLAVFVVALLIRMAG
ncbi:MAG TPA: hypothetical protein PKC45_11025 [Gemmatales bacterium]|nr:hypothetical protein [Gemmatales bacterium]